MLGMSMRLSPEMSTDMRLELSPQMRMEMRMALADRIGERLQELIRDGVTTDSKMYNLMLVRVMELVVEMTGPRLGLEAAKGLAQGIAERLFVPSIKGESLQQPETLATRRADDRVVSFLVDCLWREAKQSAEEGLSSSGLIDIGSTTGALLRQAFLEPERLAAEIAAQERLVRSTRDASAGLVHSITEGRAALTYREKLLPVVENLRQIIQNFAMGAHETSGVCPYPEFFRELVVRDRLMFLVSDKLVEGFAERVARLFKGDKLPAAPFRAAFLATVGEFTLLSFGVISARSYDLDRAATIGDAPPEGVEEGVWDQLRAKLSRASEDRTVQDWKASGGRTLAPFRHRPAGSLKGESWLPDTSRFVSQPGRVVVSEANCRTFVQHTVYAEARAVLQHFDIDELRAKCREVLLQSEEAGVRHLAIGEALVDAFENDEFLDFLKSRLRSQRWYAALEAFIVPEGSER